MYWAILVEPGNVTVHTIVLIIQNCKNKSIKHIVGT